MNQPYQRSPGKGKFAYSGINIRRPPDLMPPGRAPFMLNVSAAEDGVLQCRPVTSLVSKADSSPVHSLIRVNNQLPGVGLPWQRFLGSGGSLYSGQGTLSPLDSGYSGLPLSFVPYRPVQSPETWLYTFDANKSAKYRISQAAKYAVGIAPPSRAPSTIMARPYYTIAMHPVPALSGWVSSGIAAAPTLVQRVPSNTTTVAVIYDAGPPGWACAGVSNPTNDYAWMTAGSFVGLGAGDEVVVEQAFVQITSAKIASVIYDSGLSGLCTIQLDVPSRGLRKDQLVLVGGVSYARVLSVTEGPDGTYSFRVNLTIAASVGMTVASIPSFRFDTNSLHTAGETVSGSSISSACALSGGNLIGTGIVSRPINLDFTQSGGPGGGTRGTRAFTPEDYIHVSLRADNPQNIQEINIMLDVDATVNDFTRNYYYYVVRQGDFTPTATGALSTISSRLQSIQNEIADEFPVGEQRNRLGQSPYPALNPTQFSIPNAQQMAAGSRSWFEAMFKISDLTRVGTDPTASLAGIKAIGIMIVATGAVTVEFGDWWAGGTDGPDANFNSYGNKGIPIQYRYRYRSSLTGAYSTVSPATRNGELPRRQGVLLGLTASPDPQVDLIDIERFGGTSDTWHWCATTSNLTASYLDTITEGAAGAGDALDIKAFQPFAVTDKPRSGTCRVSGTRVVQTSGDYFNQSWVRGTAIIINNQTYTLYAPPDSLTSLETAENIGAFNTDVAFTIPEATIAGFPLGRVWGPHDRRLFACGDPFNPGLLYFTESDNPDGSADDGYIEVTSPNEPLLNGWSEYEGATYVFSAQYLYRIEKSTGGVNPYTAYRLGSSRGLAGAWAFTSRGPMVFYWAQGGIYAYAAGGGEVNLTDDDLYLLFPHEGSVGVPVTVVGFTLYPPDYNQPQSFRLAYANNCLYADYLDTQGAQQTLMYNLTTRGWMPFTYIPGVSLHYQEEGVSNPTTLAGGADGNLYQLVTGLGSDANGLIVPCFVVTPADDQGDTRARKQYGDVLVDYEGLPSIQAYYDNFLLPGPGVTVPVSGVRAQLVYDLTGDSQSLHRNIGLLIAWSGLKAQLFEWQPSYLVKPEDSLLRPTDWMDAGTIRYKFVHGIRLTADTAGQAKQVQIEFDGGIKGPILQVNHGVESTLPYSFPPFKAHLMRLVPLDSIPWRVMALEWEVNIEPEPTGVWVTQPTTFDLEGYVHGRDCQLAYASVSSTILTFIVDGKSYSLPPFPGTGGGEVKQYAPLPPLKGKLWQLSATGGGVQIYERDCEFRVKPWGSAGPYQSLKPVGEMTRSNGGARI